jgi:hypothetical protein
VLADNLIERIGIEVAMAYERLHGRNPEDVSALNLGYDIRSAGENEMRHIEVKARVTTGDVALTPNEWFKAKRFGDQYYLYIVENAVINPTLYIIRNPAGKLEVIEKIESVRFVVPYSEWKWKGRIVKV